MNSKPTVRYCRKAHQLLGDDDHAAFQTLNSQGASRSMLICDHASNAIPKRLNNLGLEPAHLQKHIAYDIGAAAVTAILSKALDARATLSGFSRLVIDVNRYLSDSSLMPEVSDGILVPSNQELAVHERMLRVEELFIPYHQEVSHQIRALQKQYAKPLIISVHSCTPVFNGLQRPWHVGVLWNNHEDLAHLAIEELSRFDDWHIGDNQPYHACEPLGYSVETHAQAGALPEVLFEIRQDLVDTPAGQEEVAARLGTVINVLLDTVCPL